MSYDYPIHHSITLHVVDRISQLDADRQLRTAAEILERLKVQPGVILADEVGMGKTFVALATAVSIYLKDKKPVVIMIPANLINKWPNDFRLFRDNCVTDPVLRMNLRCGTAKRPEELLKLLDDDEDQRCAIIFLTHGALTRSMSDGWVKLAIIQHALYRRWDTNDLYTSLGKYAGGLFELLFVENKNRAIDIWGLLLNASPEKWKKILVKHGFFLKEDDDPVSSIFIRELHKLKGAELESLYLNLRELLPKRDSPNIKSRLSEVREILNEEAKKLWAHCLQNIRLELPLLVFDEAHHLKNSKTQLVTRLFHDPVSEEEAGLLKDQFERMLFLTATPFQLGHHELVNVLDRFRTINWNTGAITGFSKEDYVNELNLLLRQLDDSQLAARKLDNSWGKLREDDIKSVDQYVPNTNEWWKNIRQFPETGAHNVKKVIEDYSLVKQKITVAEPLLAKYVIRHMKPRELTGDYSGIMRRDNLPGNLILNPDRASLAEPGGLQVPSQAMLPFLLAARLTTIQQDRRPVFAEGLASSYEAFRFTREVNLKKASSSATDIDDDVVEEVGKPDPVADWYLDQLNDALTNTGIKGSLHPKIKPTVECVMDLWSKGEKVLIFCHYIATAKALRKYISDAMRQHIQEQGSIVLNCAREEVFDRLERIGERLSDRDSSLYLTCSGILNDLVNHFPSLERHHIAITDAILRYMRTPSFLLRFAPKVESGFDSDWIKQSFLTKDGSGLTLSDIITDFLQFLDKRKEDQEEFIIHLKSVQPGGIRAKDVSIDDFDESEKEEESHSTIMANIRLCYGATKPETRQKLMKTFNTPFFPDILITSSVMAEGVDLHLNCRHIIHHDLCWNPSTLEQRTGRVDRIGAKTEKCGKPIRVYLPYISETQDEKMYRVVTERERWFNIVMGEKYKVNAITTDTYAERVPLPEELAEELAFRLEVKAPQ